MIKKVFTMKFGEITVKEIFKVIYVIGLIVIIIRTIIGIFASYSINPRWVLYRVINFNENIINLGPGLAFIAPVLLMVMVFVIITVLWKLCCELLYLIFCSLEIYIKKNNH